MKMKKKDMLALALSLIMCISLVSCKSKEVLSTNQNQKLEKEITFCESWNFDGGFHQLQSPNVTNGNFGILYFENNIYETLVNYENGKIVPGLAKEWSVSKDGKTYTFDLKKGIKFSDGTEFNAEAVKVNLENIAKNLGEYNGSYGVTSTLIGEVTAIDDDTVEVNLTKPYYGALQDFTLPLPMGMMSKNGYNEDGTLAESTKTKSFGTGPYMYDGEVKNDTYTFVKNPEYDRKAVEVEKFYVKIIPDNDAKMLALRNGEIDVIVSSMNMSYDSFDELSKDKNYQAKSSEVSVQTRTMGINVNKTIGKDKIVRQAISKAVDRTAISETIFYGVENLADTVLDKKLPYCNVDIDGYQYDVEEAKTLLEQAGWRDTNNDGIREKDNQSLKGTLVYISSNAMLDDVALAISHNLKEIGIDITPVGKETMEYFQEVSNGNYDLAIGITHAIPNDPYLLLYRMVSNPVRDNYLTQGFAGVENADTLINALNSMTKEAQIQSTYDTLLLALYENKTILPLTRVKGMVVYNSKKISDYTFANQPNFMNVAEICLK